MNADGCIRLSMSILHDAVFTYRNSLRYDMKHPEHDTQYSSSHVKRIHDCESFFKSQWCDLLMIASDSLADMNGRDLMSAAKKSIQIEDGDKRG